MTRRRPNPLALAFMAVMAAIACGSPPSEKAPVGLSGPARRPEKAASGVRALDAARVAVVPKGTFGPYVGKLGDQALLVWAAEEQAGVRSWFALPVAGSSPVGEARRLGPAPAELGVVAVRGIGTDSYFVVSSRHSAQREQIELGVVGVDGRLLGATRRLAESPKPVLWVDAASFGDRRLALWAVRSDGGADMYAVPVGARGEPAGEVQTVARDVRAWQIAAFGDSLAIGVVRSAAERGSSGPVEVLWLSGDAKPLRPPTRLTAESTAELDLDLAVTGDRLVAIWSDRRFGEARLVSAALARDGSISVPAAPFTAPLGEQALLRVVSSGSGAFAVWENLSASEPDGRAFEVAAFGPDARASKERARVTYASLDGSVPEVSATASGVAFITLSPACRDGKDCDPDDVSPAYLELDRSLAVRAYEPLRLVPLASEVVDLAWGLTCLQKGCFVLAAQNTSPAKVYLAELEARSTGWKAPARKLGGEPPPRVEETSVLALTPALAALAYDTGTNGGLVAWLTDFDPSTPWVRLKTPAPDGRLDPVRSTLTLAPLAGEGARLGALNQLSMRAHSLGGLALVAGRPEPRERVLGWVGFDAGQPQVFLTQVAPDGKKLEQRMLTRKKGGASDVGVAFVGDGYVVGWIDERSGAPELYAAKVDLRLNRVGVEQRLTKAPAVPSELVVAGDASGVTFAWSDGSDSAAGGRADLRGLRLSTKSATPEGRELRLTETATHSFSPAACSRGSETVVAWLERGSAGESNGHAAMLGTLDAKGAWKEAPHRVPIEQGAPAGLGLDCGADFARVAVLLEGEERNEIAVFEQRAGKTSPLSRVARLPVGSAADQRPVLRGSELLFDEATGSGDHRIRRVKIAW